MFLSTIACRNSIGMASMNCSPERIRGDVWPSSNTCSVPGSPSACAADDERLPAERRRLPAREDLHALLDGIREDSTQLQIVVGSQLSLRPAVLAAALAVHPPDR